MNGAVVRLVMPAKSEYLVLARLALAGIARETPMTETDLADLKLAVTEACGNAVRHAYADTTGDVEIRFVVEAGAIEIEVEDDGDAHEIVEAPTSAPSDGIPPESGMGLAIIEAIVDHVEVLSGRDGKQGTLVRMTKRLAPVSAA